MSVKGKLLLFFVVLITVLITSCGEKSDTSSPLECVNDAIENQECGIDNLGTQARTCIENKWSDWSECEMPLECANDATENQECGIDDLGTQARICVENKWSDWSDCEMPITTCTKGDTKEGDSCGVNGVMIQVCNNEEWANALCHEIDGDTRSFTVYIKTENDAVTSYLIDAAESAWNYFASVHLGLKEQVGGAVGYHAALRFENIQVPKNAEIIEAKLSFYPNSDVENQKVRINIYAEKSISSIPFDISNYDTNRPDQRLKTTVKVPEDTNNPESWRIECVSDCCKDEPDCTRLWRYDCPQRKLDCWKKDIRFTVPHDLSPVISEVKALDGWEFGNTITLFLESALNLNDGDEVGTRSINDFDERGLEFGPSLMIKYRVIE